VNQEARQPHLHPRILSPAERWAEALVVKHVREMDPLDRLERMEDLNRAAREIAMSGLRHRYPEADEAELRLREAALRLGRETMRRWFDWDPDVRGW
jgi:hypothetical protein